MKTSALLGLALLLLLSIACEDEQPDRSVTRADSAVTRADLAIMVLPAEQLGDLGLRASDLFVLADQSGYVTNAQAADAYYASPRTGGSLAALGRVDGYQLTYAVVPASDDLTDIFALWSTVDVFRDGDGASRFLRDHGTDLQRLHDTRGEDGLTSVEPIDLAPLADESSALRLLLSDESSGEPIAEMLFVGFRSDLIVGRIGIVRGVNSGAEIEAAPLAAALVQQIEAVRAGSVAAVPVKIPSNDPDAGFGGLDPARMVLQPEDLPAGVLPPLESRERQDNAIASFTREFFYASVGIVGESRPRYIRSAVHRFESEADATAALRESRDAIEADDGRQYVEDHYWTWPISEIQLSELDAGDEAVAVVLREDTEQGGQNDYVLLLIRVGDLNGEVWVSAVYGRLFAQDVLPLAEAMAERMQAAPADQHEAPWPQVRGSRIVGDVMVYSSPQRAITREVAGRWDGPVANRVPALAGWRSGDYGAASAGARHPHRSRAGIVALANAVSGRALGKATLPSPTTATGFEWIQLGGVASSDHTIRNRPPAAAMGR